MSKNVSVPFACPCKTTFDVTFRKPTRITPTVTMGVCPKCNSRWQMRYTKVKGENQVTCEFKQIEFTNHGVKRSISAWTRAIDSIKEVFK